MVRETGFEQNGDGTGVTMHAVIEEIRNPTEFIHESLELEMPWRGQPCIPDRTLKVIVETLQKGSQAMKDKWSKSFIREAFRIKQLRKEEEKAREHLHPSVRKVTDGKETVAMKELLENLGYPDAGIADEIREGFPIVGKFEHCPVYDMKPSEEQNEGADPEWLDLKAEEVREDLEALHKRTKDDEITEEVWRITCGPDNPKSETALGWAEGPMTRDEVSKRVGGHLWSPAHGFGVKQDEKTRQIDDFSRSFTNACTSTPDKVSLDGVDEILAVAKTWIELMDQATKNAGTFWARWQNGEVTEHRMHPEFKDKKNQRLKGTCVDLESAYRQLAVREDQKKYSVIGLPRGGKTLYYVCNALPFGASADVLSFNRAARALNFCIHTVAGSVVTNFFDDFVCIAPAGVADSMYARARMMLTELGWKLKKKSIISPDYEFMLGSEDIIL